EHEVVRARAPVDHGSRSSRYRESVLAIVLAEGGGKESGITLEVTPAQPGDLGSSLSRQDAQLDDMPEGVALFAGSLVYRRELVIGEHPATCRALDDLEALTGRAVDVAATLRPGEEYFDRCDRVVLLGDGLSQLVDPMVDVLRLDL